MSDLTPEQREALAEAAWERRGWLPLEGDDPPTPDDFRHFADALAPTIARLLAEAWDEGDARGWSENPYRGAPEDDDYLTTRKVEP